MLTKLSTPYFKETIYMSLVRSEFITPSIFVSLGPEDWEADAPYAISVSNLRPPDASTFSRKEYSRRNRVWKKDGHHGTLHDDSAVCWLLAPCHAFRQAYITICEVIVSYEEKNGVESGKFGGGYEKQRFNISNGSYTIACRIFL